MTICILFVLMNKEEKLSSLTKALNVKFVNIYNIFLGVSALVSPGQFLTLYLI